MNNTLVKKICYKGHEIELHRDDDAEAPDKVSEFLGTIWQCSWTNRHNHYDENPVPGACITACSGGYNCSVSADKARKEFGDNIPAVRKCLASELAEYRAWCEGEVYGYIARNPQTGEIIDACWGFYGESSYAIEEAKRAIDNAVENSVAEFQEPRGYHKEA